MIEQKILAMPGPASAMARERAIARHIGVKIRTLRALGLVFTDRASAERWLTEAPAEAILALHASETGLPMPTCAAAA